MPAPLMDMKGPSHHQAFFLQQQQFFFFFFPQLFFYRLKKWRGNLKRRINFQNSAKTQTCLTSFFGGGVFPKKIVQKGSKKSSELSRKSDGFLPPNHQRWHAKMEAQSEYVHPAYTFFLHAWRRFACSVGAYQTKFLHRSSVGSSLRVGCRLGRRRKNPTTSLESLPMKSNKAQRGV